MTTVTCVGLAVQDLVFTMDAPILLGEKNFAVGLGAIGGGPAANAAVAIARLGATPRLITALGTDAIGDEIVTELAGYGVDCAGVRRVEAPSPLSAVVIAPDGDRTIFNRTDPLLWSGAFPPSGDEIAQSDAVLVDVRWGEGALAAVVEANQRGIPSVVDCDLTEGPVSEALMRAADHVVFSQPAFERVRSRATPSAVRDVAAEFGGVIAVTKGGDGVAVVSGRRRNPPQVDPPSGSTRSTRSVPVTSSTVRMPSAWPKAAPLDDIVEWASAVAAVKCCEGGGHERAFPTQDRGRRCVPREERDMTMSCRASSGGSDGSPTTTAASRWLPSTSAPRSRTS